MFKNKKFIKFIVASVAYSIIFSTTFFIGVVYNQSFNIFDFCFSLSSELIGLVIAFVSAIFTVALKTPRHGYFASSGISFLFVIPVIAIVYLTQNILLWSSIYFVVLLIGSAICVMNISDKISRPQIMSRL